MRDAVCVCMYECGFTFSKISLVNPEEVSPNVHWATFRNFPAQMIIPDSVCIDITASVLSASGHKVILLNMHEKVIPVFL